MPITLEELLVRIRVDGAAAAVRDIGSIDRATSQMARAGGEVGRAWDRGMSEVSRASERAARDTIRAGERAARESVRAAQTAAREQTRLANQVAREQEAAARRTEAAIRRSSAAAAQMAGDLGRNMTLAGAGLAGGLALAGRTAVQFEAAFSDVRKTVDASEAELATLEKTLRRMATTEIPLKFEELSRIAALGGQLGIATKDIEGFTRTVAMLGATTDLSAEEAAESMARLSNVMKLSGADFGRLGSTIVDLGNKFAAGEGEILAFSQRLAPAARVAGLATQDVLALSTALASIGVEPEAGATAMSRLLADVANAASKGGKELKQFAQIAGVSAAQFQQLFRRDAGQSILLLVEGLGKLRAQGVNLFPVLDGLGIRDVRMRQAILGLASSHEDLRKALARSRGEWGSGNALVREHGERAKTTAAQLQLFQNQIREAGAAIGVQLLPMLRDALRQFQSLLSAFSSLDPAAQRFIATAGMIGAAVLLLGGRVLSVVSGIIQLRAALAGLTAANAAAAVSGSAAAAAGGAGAVAARFGPVGAAVGVGLLAHQATERQRQAGLGVSLNFGPGSVSGPGTVFHRPPAALGELREREGREAAARQAQRDAASREAAKARAELRQAGAGLDTRAGAPSVPAFDTKESKAAASKAAAAAKRAAQEAQRLAEERARNLAQARLDLRVEEMLARGETRQAFIEQGRRPGVSDALLGRTFDTRQFRQAEDERRRREAQDAQRVQDERDRAERGQREALASTLVDLSTQRRISGLRAAGQEREADFQEMLAGNRELNTLLAAQPALMEHVRGVFNETWSAQQAESLKEAVDTFADLRRELIATTEDARAAAAGIADSFEERFRRFARERPEILSAFALGDMARVGEAISLFGSAEDARLGQEKAQILKEINDELERERRLMRATPEEAFAIGLERKNERGEVIRPDADEVRRLFRERQDLERERIRRQSHIELDQRREALRGGDFGAFRVAQERVTEQGQRIQPFDLDELRQRFAQLEELRQLEQVATGVRDVFYQAFMDIGEGFKGFFNSILSGFQQMLTQMAAEFLSSQIKGFLTNLVLGAIGGGGTAAVAGNAVSGGTSPMIPHAAVSGLGRPTVPTLPAVPAAAVAVAGVGGGRAPIIVNMTVNARDAASFRGSEGQIAADLKRRLDRTMRDL